MTKIEKKYLAFCNTPDANKKKFEVISSEISANAFNSTNADTIITNGNEIAIMSDEKTLKSILGRFAFLNATECSVDDKKYIHFTSHAQQIFSSVMFFLGK